MSFVLLGACDKSSNIPENLPREWIRAPSFDDALESPVIVTGRIGEVTSITPPQRSRKMPEIFVHFVKFQVIFEAVFRGNVDNNEPVIYAYLYSETNSRDLGPPVFHPESGQRRLFFLERQEGRLRLRRDVVDYTIRVWSGTPSPTKASDVTDVGLALARALLIPGSGYSPEMFAVHLSEYCYYARLFSGIDIEVELLASLRRWPDVRVRDEANTLWRALQAHGYLDDEGRIIRRSVVGDLVSPKR